MYLLDRVVFCCVARIELVDEAKLTFKVFVIDSLTKIPAWIGTIPHVTMTRAVDAQKTAQCLVKRS